MGSRVFGFLLGFVVNVGNEFFGLYKMRVCNLGVVIVIVWGMVVSFLDG